MEAGSRVRRLGQSFRQEIRDELHGGTGEMVGKQSPQGLVMVGRAMSRMPSRAGVLFKKVTVTSLLQLSLHQHFIPVVHRY